jgi:hypothetical protein
MFTACLTFFRLSRSIKKRHFRCGGADEDVQIKSLTNDQTILVLAGPKARAVMQMVSRDDWSKEGFPWLSVREYFIGFAPATIMLVSFSGEHAYKIHVPNASLYTAYTALKAAGETHGLRLFGALAVESMRLEKGYLHWKADIFTRRHRHRPRGQACHTRDNHRALAGICCCNADNQGGHRYDAIVRPKHRRTQPIAARNVMRLARVRRRIRHVQFAFVVLASLGRNQDRFYPPIGSAPRCA